MSIPGQYPHEKPLDPGVAEYSVTEPTRGVRIHLQAFINRHGHKTSRSKTSANRYDTDKAESNPRASVGRRSANNIQQGKAER